MLSEVDNDLTTKSVGDMWNFMQWNWSIFQSLLPNNILLKLAAKQVNPFASKEDSFTWRGCSLGNFSVKSAF